MTEVFVGQNPMDGECRLPVIARDLGCQPELLLRPKNRWMPGQVIPGRTAQNILVPFR